MTDESVLVTAAMKSRAEILEEQKAISINIKQFSPEEMDELMYMATVKAAAKAEIRISENEEENS